VIQDSLDLFAEVGAHEALTIISIVVFFVILSLALVDTHRVHKKERQKRDRELPQY